MPRRTRFPHGGARQSRERKQHVEAFLNLLRDSREELARIVTLENGKTIRESRAEVDSALVEGSHHVNQIEAFYEGSGPAAFSDKTWMQYEPVGVAGIISPWNFPMNVMCRKTLPALLTGNTVVFKPATFTPWSGVFMATLLEKAGLPAGVFNCVTGAGSSIGNAIVTDPRVRAVSFTGSTEVGKQIQRQAAANLTRTQLELGGKNALIVMDDADLAQAVDAAITAGFSNAGQWCTSTSRVLLHRPIVRPFLEMLVARCEKMTVGDGLSETTDMGPVAGPGQYQDIRAAISEAEAEGARLVTGGDPEPASTRAPSRRATSSARRCSRTSRPTWRFFARRFSDRCWPSANSSRWTRRSPSATGRCTGCLPPSSRAAADTARAYIDGIEAGLAHVNIHTGYKEPSMPFGGVKQSGAGLPENSETGLEFFVDRKAVYVRG